MIDIGKYHNLRILRKTDIGLMLGDETGEEVLMHIRFCPAEYELDDVIKVFVYQDGEGRKVASTLTPKITLYDFALLRVTAVTNVGAFLDWGLEKELLVPFREQKQKMQENRWYIVYLDLDEETNRLYATSKFERQLDNTVLTVEQDEEVDLMVYKITDLGYSVIVNNTHKGLIFKTDVFRDLDVGGKLKGYIKNIRSDNKLDITLHKPGFLNVKDENTALIYRTLQENGGFLPITDKSSPDEIYNLFGISKKAFKNAIGNLYKQKKITILPVGIKIC